MVASFAAVFGVTHFALAHTDTRTFDDSNNCGANTNGHEHKDVFHFQAGFDCSSGFDAGDELYGGDDADGLNGQDGFDRIEGGSGYDDLGGDAGDDVVEGGNGGDEIEGGSGQDELRGGDENDDIDARQPNADSFDGVNGGSGNSDICRLDILDNHDGGCETVARG